jgi:uncharacterized membrane protein (DUF485 family)
MTLNLEAGSRGAKVVCPHHSWPWIIVLRPATLRKQLWRRQRHLPRRHQMRQELTHKIRSNPKFAELTQKRTKFGVQLSILMLLIYYGFILIVAFAPSVLGIPIYGVVTLGIPIGVFIIVAAFVLTGIYVRRANSEFDSLTRQIIEEARQ